MSPLQPFVTDGNAATTTVLRSEGHAINRKRVQRLMRKMGIAALGPKPRTTTPAPGHKISMDGRGRWMDNVFIERLWRSLKHEDIYLKGYADGRTRRSATGRRWRCGARASPAHSTTGLWI